MRWRRVHLCRTFNWLTLDLLTRPEVDRLVNLCAQSLALPEALDLAVERLDGALEVGQRAKRAACSHSFWRFARGGGAAGQVSSSVRVELPSRLTVLAALMLIVIVV